MSSSSAAIASGDSYWAGSWAVKVVLGCCPDTVALLLLASVLLNCMLFSMLVFVRDWEPEGGIADNNCYCC